MFHLRRPVEPGDSDHVESSLPLMKPFVAQKKLRRLNHPLLLSARDGFRRSSEGMIGTGFHLNKDNNFMIQQDKVHLAAATPIISLHNSIALLV